MEKKNNEYKKEIGQNEKNWENIENYLQSRRKYRLSLVDIYIKCGHKVCYG